MKHIYILIFNLLIHIITQGQSIVLLNEKGAIITDTAVSIKGTNNDETLQYKVKVSNKNATPISVKVTETLVLANLQSSYSYSWGKLYNKPSVGHTTEAVKVISGISRNEFIFQFHPEGKLGTNRFTLVFFDEKDQENFAYLTLRFVINLANNSDKDIRENYVSALHPNPAKDFTTITYSVEREAKILIKISNVIGVVAKNIEVKQNTGKLTIDTSKLKPGAYIFSFLVNDKVIKTGKLIISN